MLTSTREANTLHRAAMAFPRAVITLHRAVMAFPRGVMAFPRTVMALHRAVTALHRAVAALHHGANALHRGTLPLVRDLAASAAAARGVAQPCLATTSGKRSHTRSNACAYSSASSSGCAAIGHVCENSTSELSSSAWVRGNCPRS